MVSLTKKIVRNFISQLSGRILALILGFFVISLMMRYLGPEQYGYYSTAVAFLQVFGIIADFGLYLLTLQYLGEADALKEKGNKDQTEFIMNNIFTLRFLSAFVFYGGAIIFCLFFPFSKIVKLAIGILSGSFFFCTLNQILAAFYQKTLRAEKIAQGEVFGKVIMLFLIILFIRLNFGFYFILSIFAFGNLVNFLILFFSTKKKTFFKFRFNFSFWKKVLKDAWPVGLAIVFNTIYFKSDTLLLSFYRPPEDVGFYGGCYRILEILITVPPLFIGLVLPKITKAYKEKNNFQLKELVQKSFDFLVMLAVPMIFATFVLAKRIMILIGGSAFSISGDILKILIIATGILFIGEFFKSMIISLNKQRLAVWFYLFTAVFALTGYFLFIPRYSYWGAAGMTIASELLMFIFAVFIVYREIKFFPNLIFTLKSLIAGLIMFLVLFCLKNQSLFLLILTAFFIYFTSLYLLKGISKETLKKVIGIK